MQFKVFIPSAGLGSRLGPYTKFVNKALISIGNLPVIVRIIKKFPVGSEIVIATGYRGDQLKQVIISLCSDYVVTFVEISRFDGDDSSLGHTLKECRDHLQAPFIFIPNDTLVDTNQHTEFLSFETDWVGYYEKKDGDGIPKDQYRTLEINDGMVTQINPKGIDSNNIYIGVAGIKNYNLFWKNFDDASDIRPGEVVGLSKLPNLKGVSFDSWQDVGNILSLRKSQKAYRDPDVNILEKEDEAIWFTNEKVVKFHVDKKFISDRVKRLTFLPSGLFPKVIEVEENIFSYDKVKGEVLSRKITPSLMIKLLNQVQYSLWCHVDVNNEFNNNLEDFYKKKTKSRIAYYFERFEKTDKKLIINGIEVPKTSELLEEINWQKLINDSRISHFHGDFHSENILVTKDKQFKLIDWRQNFGEGNYQFGDTYYDLAKFLHGLIVSHEQVDQNNFAIKRYDADTIDIDIHMLFKNYICISEFKEWCYSNAYSYPHVELLTSLIFLNICSLHEHPYSEFLFYLGLYLLKTNLNSFN